ncbi:alpha-mannosidase [Arachidicoccus ginsenosidimutans]|uniref:GH92 family glycosyl hydrolase n=1 Tax=Arachidicoccus sp. BS20 TaxID=1850526 RepID=UPI0007F0C443|nr:GH92 family glycosyl hydrolase [Arachidicoccus sp. BS20]ANI89648.1 alpha-mannosidase [Arachidicoccus sp. BS20]
MRILIFVCAILITLKVSAFHSVQKKDSLPDLLKYVNGLQGTNSNPDYSNGNIYPAIALPFGMNFWSPQTGENGNGWKYQYSATTIRGFGETHQCSPWMNDYGVFSLMPVSGKLSVDENQRAATFSHQNEIAKPNYYRVKFDNGITTEIAPTVRGAHFRFRFPKQKSYIVLDGYTGLSEVKIYPKEHKITGFVHNGIFIPGDFKNYFELVFNQPFVAYGTWNKNGTITANSDSTQGTGTGAYIEFKKGATVEAKVASSYISPQQADLNLQRELGRFKNFDATKNAAAQIWNKLLNRILVEGGSEKDKATFYSCLYRANLFPCKFYEYNKDNKPYYYDPNDGKIYQGYFYTDEGYWDTFRAQFPLSNILHPQMQGRYMQSILAVYEHCGWLPSWSFPAETGGVMIGNHAISLLADAWAKGIRTFNPDTALKAYFHEATNTGNGRFGRSGWKDYFTLGYVPYPQGGIGATAKTLEYAYDDFCGYQLAKMTHNHFYEKIFAKQMYNYRNVFDTATNFVRGRDSNGKWNEPFNPYEWGGPFVEGNAWHYTWSVFQNVQDLINLIGGKQQFIKKLDSVFDVSDSVVTGTYHHTIHEMREMQSAHMGQYAQGNEPIHHMIYLYDYAGEPWKTQQHIREVMSKLYNATENGYPGDEDEGEMSSWYVLSALGIYSVCPGTNQYVIGSPVFQKATITLENGKQFIIEANHNDSASVYIQNATLNGKSYSHNWITYDDITNGGVLHFDMGNRPNFQRGIQVNDLPFSLLNEK